MMVYIKIVSKGKQSLGASFNIKNKARDLRKNLTKQERKLWARIRKRQLNGMYFRRQHPYNIYILDFYCFEAKMAIEVDGDIHLCRKDYDDERTRCLESSGVKVLRFSNEDIDKNIDWVLSEICKCL